MRNMISTCFLSAAFGSRQPSPEAMNVQTRRKLDASSSRLGLAERAGYQSVRETHVRRAFLSSMSVYGTTYGTAWCAPARYILRPHRSRCPYTRRLVAGAARLCTGAASPVSGGSQRPGSRAAFPKARWLGRRDAAGAATARIVNRHGAVAAGGHSISHATARVIDRRRALAVGVRASGHPAIRTVDGAGGLRRCKRRYGPSLP